jgi:hypothetical protein
MANVIEKYLNSHKHRAKSTTGHLHEFQVPAIANAHQAVLGARVGLVAMARSWDPWRAVKQSKAK